ncbi:glycine reductase [Anaerobranca gottschalkii DSM 13577]|uniref:Glycine reductase n=3 Tax=Anaerobranca gottschalkii TaxID=108328 RepID=A0A1I0CDF9_9FIRM|nr:glycine reductase [Anaerobranca gottschalkii DSM 13577]
MEKLRVVHYLNQFFGQIGGEDKAHIAPMVKEGFVGPGMALANQIGEIGEIVATVICGDSYFNENIDGVAKEVVELIGGYNPDIVVCGPAFNAGRYGVACGAVAKGVFDKLQIPVVTAMYQENPGVEMYSKYAYVVKAADSARGMGGAISDMAKIIKKLAKGEELNPERDNYFPRGIRKNYFTEKRGSMRAVEMLIKKLKGEEYVTEYPMPDFDRVAPNQPIVDLKKAKIALVTSGGIVPKGNPDRIESSSASKYGKYDISSFTDLTEETHETAHGGYDPVYANEDSDRVLPVDILRELEEAGEIGSLHKYYYATVGNGTSVANAKAFAKAIGEELVRDGVDAVILTST